MRDRIARSIREHFSIEKDGLRVSSLFEEEIYALADRILALPTAPSADTLAELRAHLVAITWAQNDNYYAGLVDGSMEVLALLGLADLVKEKAE